MVAVTQTCPLPGWEGSSIPWSSSSLWVCWLLKSDRWFNPTFAYYLPTTLILIHRWLSIYKEDGVIALWPLMTLTYLS